MDATLNRKGRFRLAVRNLLAWGAVATVTIGGFWIAIVVDLWIRNRSWDAVLFYILLLVVVPHIVIVVLPSAAISAWRLRRSPIRKFHPAPYLLTLPYTLSQGWLTLLGGGIAMILSIPVAGFIHWRMARQFKHFVGKQGYLGVSLVGASGAVNVEYVKPGLPAGEAGIQSGDVIVAINGQRVTVTSDVTTALHGTTRGDRIEVSLRRGEEDLTVTAALADRKYGSSRNS